MDNTNNNKNNQSQQILVSHKEKWKENLIGYFISKDYQTLDKEYRGVCKNKFYQQTHTNLK